MTQKEQLVTLRTEVRPLRQRVAQTERAWKQQSARADRLAEEKKALQHTIKELQKERAQLHEENKTLRAQLGKSKEHTETLQGMIFKPNRQENVSAAHRKKRKRGGQYGHRGHGRKKPQHIDQEIHISLTNCPSCDTQLESSDTTHERTVEDIVFPQTTTVTLYHIAHQWCARCKQEVRGSPPGTLEGFRIGLNLIIWILIQKYRLRLPLNLISESLQKQYGLTLSVGGIQNILHQMKQQFTPQYNTMIATIRKARKKHADETGWRIQGRNVWCWLFATSKTALYTIEETRGKGVPATILGEYPRGVLVRDDYGSYEHLDMPQQSCWAHLLRKSREAAVRETASDEAQTLHQELKTMFHNLSKIVATPYRTTHRRRAYTRYEKQLAKIITREYTHDDSCAIQTRMRNQGTNLITAVHHNGVPLTNNHAERQIRPIVVTRKISGGSQSDAGAKTHAVNMSIMQTLSLRKTPFPDGLRTLLMTPRQKYVLERTE